MPVITQQELSETLTVLDPSEYLANNRHAKLYTVDSVQCTLYTIQCTLYTVQYSLQFTVYSVHCTLLYTVQCTVQLVYLPG